ncbi:hypothetical protein ACQP0C_00905 [Nocardia sp. CA-129566]|uniref:hypothetical protein n=1 Tax=Nocardia sp. CA-129566 TaxID=3239976 RepID=UPI003D9864C4
MQSLIAVVGTLLGAVVGVLGSYTTQSLSYRRESSERLATVRRQAYVEFLVAVHDMYVQILAIHRTQRAGTMTPVEATQSLHEIPSRNAQAALENLRLLAGDVVAGDAAFLWARMRRDAEPLGRDLDAQRFAAWRERYWDSRRKFIDAARRDIGFRSLDWSTAGVGPGRQHNDISIDSATS